MTESEGGSDVHLNILDNEKLNFVIVTGKESEEKSFGKSFYVRNELAKEKEYFVVTVNETFSVDKVIEVMKNVKEKDMSKGCVVHFKISPFCKMSEFNAFLHDWFVTNKLSGGDSVSFEVPCDMTIAFEIEEGSLETVPALSLLKSKGGDRVKEVVLDNSMRTIREQVFKDLPKMKDEKDKPRSNKRLFTKSKLQYPDQTDCKLWYFQKPLQGLGRFSVTDPKACVHSDGTSQDFDENGVCAKCGRKRDDVCWQLLCSSFGVDDFMLSKMKRVIEEDNHFAMTRKCALRLIFLNECIIRNQPVIVEENTETIHVLSILLNGVSVLTNYRVELLQFLNRYNSEFAISMGETTEQMIESVKKYLDVHKDDTEDFCESVYRFLKRQDSFDSFYTFESVGMEMNQYHDLEKAFNDLRGYIQTKARLFETFKMKKEVTVADLKGIIDRTRRIIERFAKDRANGSALKFVLFIEDCTSSKDLMGLVKELIIDHSFAGEDLPPQLVVIGSYNKSATESLPKSFIPFIIG